MLLALAAAAALAPSSAPPNQPRPYDCASLHYQHRLYGGIYTHGIDCHTAHEWIKHWHDTPACRTGLPKPCFGDPPVTCVHHDNGSGYISPHCHRDGQAVSFTYSQRYVGGGL